MKALINNKTRDLISVDRSKLSTENVIRVIWIDKKGRRVTSFIEEKDLLNYYDTVY